MGGTPKPHYYYDTSMVPKVSWNIQQKRRHISAVVALESNELGGGCLFLFAHNCAIIHSKTVKYAMYFMIVTLTAQAVGCHSK